MSTSLVMRRLCVLAELLSCTFAVVHDAPKATKDNAKRPVGQNGAAHSAGRQSHKVDQQARRSAPRSLHA
jgi:hypothetical protein